MEIEHLTIRYQVTMCLELPVMDWVLLIQIEPAASIVRWKCYVMDGAQVQCGTDKPYDRVAQMPMLD